MTTRRFLWIGFVLLVLPVLLSAWFALRGNAIAVATDDTFNVSSQLSFLLSTLREAESGQRGYLLTDNPSYLDEYDSALMRAPALLQALRTAYSSGAEAAEFSRLQALSAAKFAELQSTVALCKAGQRNAALAIVTTNRGKALMDQAFALIHQMESEQRARLTALQAATAWNGRFLQLVTVLSVFATLALALLAIQTNRKQTLQLLAAQEQLRQSQKMEVIGQLTGGIAHDFNNLLTIIMGSLELLQRNLADADAKTTRRIEAAMEGARRAAALTHRLLAFARRQPLEAKPLQPNRLIAEMVEMLHRVLGEQVALQLVTGAGLWQVIADAPQLENAILNLAVNARDAMPTGGHLTIETQNTYLDDIYAARQAEVEPGQYVMIGVTDTGSGMTPEVRAKVFEPFFTTKMQGQGTGLGLAQVYGFIKQSRGHVTIYSEPGHGTTVRLYLPRLRGVELADAAGAAGNAVAKVTGAPADAGFQGKDETILVVEDEENVRNFVAEVLREYGYGVVVAENADAALKIVRQESKLHMLFTDVVLTGRMNGRQLAEQILQMRPDISVLYTTGYTRNAIIHHGRLDDGIDFIGKPFTAAKLVRAVRQVLDKAKV